MPQKGTGSTASRERNQGMVDKVNGNSNGNGDIFSTNVGKRISKAVKGMVGQNIGNKLIDNTKRVISHNKNIEAQKTMASKKKSIIKPSQT